jgi:glycoprotein-N-acetylgalactosamine 3-beta-galactosyltransferase
MAASNVTEPSLGAFGLKHVGAETYGNMWNKVQAMWYYVHEHYLLEFDWFHIGGDDMYIIPENLRRTSAAFDPKRARILGASIPNSKNPKRRYCGGGAGYTLNRRALHLLVGRFESGECPSELAPDEDVRLSRCLEDAGVKCTDTNDDHEEVRYHHLDAQFHAAWVPTRNALWLWEKLQYFHGIRGNQTMLAQISNTSVSFHLDKSMIRSRARDRGLRRYHAILYDKCGADFSNQVAQAATCSDEERNQQSALWKRTPKAKELKEFE